MDPSSSIDARLSRARALLDLDRPAEALQLLAPLVAESPEDARMRIAVADAHLALDDHVAAAREASSAIALAPADAEGHRLLALALEAQGGWRLGTRARDAAREAVRLAPFSIPCLFALELAELACGDKRSARGVAEEILRLAPTSPFAHHAVGWVALAERNWREAEGCYRRALALQPDWSPALNNLAVALRAQRRHQEAIELFASAARLDPKEERHHENVVSTAKQFVAPGGFILAYLLLRALGAATAGPIAGVGLVALVIAYVVVRRRRLRQLSPGVRMALRSADRPSRKALVLLGVPTAAAWAFVILTLTGLLAPPAAAAVVVAAGVSVLVAFFALGRRRAAS